MGHTYWTYRLYSSYNKLMVLHFIYSTVHVAH